MYGFNQFEERKYSMKHVSKELNIGRTKLFKGLKELGILDNNNTPKKEFEAKGLFSEKVGKYSTNIYHGLTTTTRATANGIDFIAKICKEHPEKFM